MIPFAGVVTAAGSSSRWGGLPKKEYHRLDGTPVLARACLPFLQLQVSCSLVLTVPAGHRQEVQSLLDGFVPLERILIVAGGSSRQESVYRGLQALEKQAPEFVLIHDGCRPWISRSLIEAVLETARRYGACIPVYRAPEAPKRVGPSGLVIEDLRRGEIYNAQTPQGFSYPAILEAHRRAVRDRRDFIDDAGVYAAYCGPVFTIPGERRNCKITFPEDLEP